MEQWEIEKIKALINKDEELKRLWEEHLEFEEKINKIVSKGVVTPADDMELKRLKHEKLKGKDKIFQILRKYEQVG